MSARNRHAQELHEQTTTHARFSDWKLLSKKYSSNDARNM